MGHKIKPTSYRIGITKPWKSRYFLKKGLPFALEEDETIRAVIREKLAKMGIESLEIERTTDAMKVLIRSARPGLIIGRGGTGIDELRKAITSAVLKLRKKRRVEGKFNLEITVEEVRSPETSAKVVAENIANEFEKRTPFRRVIKQTMARIIQHKDVKGAKIQVSGRLDGAEISRREWIREGSIPLVTIRSDIDYAEAEAHCTYGVVGIKVWVYKGEKLE